jgi:hypothetical protein
MTYLRPSHYKWLNAHADIHTYTRINNKILIKNKTNYNKLQTGELEIIFTISTIISLSKNGRNVNFFHFQSSPGFVAGVPSFVKLPDRSSSSCGAAAVAGAVVVSPVKLPDRGSLSLFRLRSTMFIFVKDPDSACSPLDALDSEEKI